MRIVELAIPDVRLIQPAKLADQRGFFSETYNRPTWEKAGIVMEFVQDNQSYSVNPGTLRGLHFQVPPAGQHKIVRVARGRILDVAVDIRKASPTFGQHVAIELSAESGEQVYIPAGFAHGFVTLEPCTEVNYKASHVYSPQYEAGILWNDPDLGIAWPFAAAMVTLSERDLRWARFKDSKSPF